MRTLLLAAVLLVGCDGGSDPATPNDALVGAWLYDGGDFGAALAFYDDGTYAAHNIYPTGASSALDQIEKGSFDADGRRVSFFPSQSTCPGPVPSYYSDYVARASTITLTGGSLAVTFERIQAQDPSGGLALTLGCFYPDGTFAPGPLSPVSN